jgi:hypothetical protein
MKAKGAVRQTRGDTALPKSVLALRIEGSFKAPQQQAPPMNFEAELKAAEASLTWIRQRHLPIFIPPETAAIDRSQGAIGICDGCRTTALNRADLAFHTRFRRFDTGHMRSTTSGAGLDRQFGEWPAADAFFFRPGLARCRPPTRTPIDVSRAALCGHRYLHP